MQFSAPFWCCICVPVKSGAPRTKRVALWFIHGVLRSKNANIIRKNPQDGRKAETSTVTTCLCGEKGKQHTGHRLRGGPGLLPVVVVVNLAVTVGISLRERYYQHNCVIISF